MANVDWWTKSHISYPDYLKLEATIGANRQIADEQTDRLAGVLEWQSDGFTESLQELSESIGEHLQGINDQIEGISSQLGDIGASVDDLRQTVGAGLDAINATLHWGFSEIVVEFTSVSARLDELVRLARSPSQTWAYEQFDTARDEVRRGLYAEAKESVQRAISGFGSNPGYKTDFRFHFLLGTILLGSRRNADTSILDPKGAEDAFLASSRYAGDDYKLEKALALVFASRAAYVQKRLPEGAEYVRIAASLEPALAQARYMQAKIACASAQPQEGFGHLKKAIEINNALFLDAARDKEFSEHGAAFREFMVGLTQDATTHAENAARRLSIDIEKLKKLSVGSFTAQNTVPDEFAEASSLLIRSRNLIGKNMFFDSIKAEAAANQGIASCWTAAERFGRSSVSSIDVEIRRVIAELRGLSEAIVRAENELGAINVGLYSFGLVAYCGLLFYVYRIEPEFLKSVLIFGGVVAPIWPMVNFFHNRSIRSEIRRLMDRMSGVKAQLADLQKAREASVALTEFSGREFVLVGKGEYGPAI